MRSSKILKAIGKLALDTNAVIAWREGIPEVCKLNYAEIILLPVTVIWKGTSAKPFIEQDEDGRYVVECTDLPGCMTEGDTLKEAIENINEAIVGCLKSRLKTASDKIHITSLPSRMSIDVDTSGIHYA